jgi:hypothetical protein
MPVTSASQIVTAALDFAATVKPLGKEIPEPRWRINATV